MDIIFLTLKGSSVRILSMLCAGTYYHVVEIVKRTKHRDPSGYGEADQTQPGTPLSRDVWQAYMRGWVRYFGHPAATFSDNGMEFGHHMTRGLELAGVLQRTSNTYAPLGKRTL